MALNIMDHYRQSNSRYWAVKKAISAIPILIMLRAPAPLRRIIFFRYTTILLAISLAAAAIHWSDWNLKPTWNLLIPLLALIVFTAAEFRRGLYRYDMIWEIADVSELVTSERVMTELRANPNKYFPFNVEGRAPFNLEGIGPRGIYSLNGVRWPGDNNNLVAVEELSFTATSFKFITLKGHFDDPGSEITFSTFEEDGKVFLRQSANARNICLFDLLAESVAHSKWQKQASNLRRQFGRQGLEEDRSDGKGIAVTSVYHKRKHLWSQRIKCHGYQL